MDVILSVIIALGVPVSLIIGGIVWYRRDRKSRKANVTVIHLDSNIPNGTTTVYKNDNVLITVTKTEAKD